MNICVIDNTDGDLTTDFVKLFYRIDKNVTVIVYNINEPSLLSKIKSIKSLDGIILTGSNRRILHDNHHIKLPPSLLDMNIPILGICYGFQWMAYVRGGSLLSFDNNKLCIYNKYITMPAPFNVTKRMYKFLHHDYVSTLPKTFSIVVKLSDKIVIAYEKKTGHIGVQFHPELHNSSATEFFKKWLIWINDWNTI